MEPDQKSSSVPHSMSRPSPPPGRLVSSLWPSRPCDHFRRLSHPWDLIDPKRLAPVHADCAFAEQSRHLFHNVFFVGAEATHDAIPDRLGLAPPSRAPTEHRHWRRSIRPPERYAQVPERPTASEAASFHADVDGQASADVALGFPVMALHNLPAWIVDRMGECKCNVVHLDFSCF